MRNKLYSLINIGGLAVGLAACLLILLYMQYEFSYDTYHRNAKRIYRVTEHIRTPGGVNTATTPVALAPILKSNFPEVEKTARLVQMSHYTSVYKNVLISLPSARFYGQYLYYADPSIFQVFTIPVLEGDAKTGLSRPFTLFISSSIAREYFGKQDPMGETVKIGGAQQVYQITGVFRDFPPNSHLHADFLASFASIASHSGANTDWSPAVYTYLLLKNKSGASIIQKQFPTIIKKDIPLSVGRNISFSLMPLLRIHLHSDLRFEPERQGDIGTVCLFGAIALMILIIACFNYINMATARATKRALETAVRKAVGASRRQLAWQYFLESLLLNLFAMVIAAGLVKWLLPYFDRLAGLPISLQSLSYWWIVVLTGSMLLTMSVLAGGYPAMLLSSFRPVAALKGKMIPSSGLGLRKGLVVTQFVISIVLIICAIVLQRQMNYIRRHRLGDGKSRVILIRDRGELTGAYPAFKSELLSGASIREVTTTQLVPGFTSDKMNFKEEDIEDFHGKISMAVFYGDDDFLNTFGISILRGRNFSRDYPADSSQSVLINEAAVKKFGWKYPVGKHIAVSTATLSGGELKISRHQKQVIGVVKDFHNESLRKRVAPALIELSGGPFTYIAVKTGNQHLAQTLSFTKHKWNAFVPGKPLDYSFLDDDYATMYRPDDLMQRIFRYFSFLAVIIACLGLLGLTAFSVEQRTKEIGIRKTMGASVGSITGLLSADFFRLVLIAIIIATPLAWWVMSKWLRNFAYRIHLHWWIFLMAGVLALFIAGITIGFQTVRAARANPVKSLRTE